MYAHGQSEEMLGKALRGHDRDDLALAMKCWFRMRSTPNAKGLSRKHILEAVEASLKRLNTDYIDLYQVHGPDPFTPLEETMKALDDLVRSGKVRYIGCSNFHGWQIAKANGISDRLGLYRFVSGQYMYNLLRRDSERDILPACADAEWEFCAGVLERAVCSQENTTATMVRQRVLEWTFVRLPIYPVTGMNKASR